MKKLLLLFIFFAVAFGCRSKKIVSEESNRDRDSSSVRIERVIDTVFRDRVIEKIRPVYSEVIVEKPCDSAGNLIPVNYNIGSGGNSFHVFSENGKLYINQKIDSVESSFEKQYRARWEKDSLALRNTLISESSTTEEIVRYVYPWWWWLAVIVGGALALLWVLEKFNVLARVRKLVFKV